MHSTPVFEWKSSKYGNNRWFTYSPKARRIVNLYSDLEYDHWILVEFNPAITSFCEQPRRIEGIDKNGKYIESILDMWCGILNDKGYYVEVKYQCELEPTNIKYSERSAKQVDFQRAWCEHNGFHYQVQTDKEIYKNKILLSNCKKMLPYIDDRSPIVETDHRRIITSLKTNTSMTIGMIAEETQLSNQRIKDVVYRLIYNGNIKSDVNLNPLGSETVVTLQ